MSDRYPFMSLPLNAEDIRARKWLSLTRPSSKIHGVQEEKAFLGMLRFERHYLVKLTHEISNTELALSRLYGQREDCVLRINRYSVALSPHSRLPSEILAKIFVESIGDEETVLPPRKAATPWVFLWVCSKWRQIALAEHRLWDCLAVLRSLYRPAEDVVRTFLPLLWAPTQTFPVSLRLKVSDRDFGVSGIFSSYSHRLRSISVEADRRVIFKTLFRPQVSFNSLESLVINVLNGTQYNLGFDSSLTASATFPALREITIMESSYNFKSSTFIPQLP